MLRPESKTPCLEPFPGYPVAQEAWFDNIRTVTITVEEYRTLIRSNEMMALLYRLFKNVESYNFRSMAEYVFDNAYPMSPEEQDDA